MSTCSTNIPGFYGKGSVEVTSNPPKGEGAVRRLAISADKLVESPAEGISTAHDILNHAARVHGNKPALGYRDVIDIHEEEKQVEKVVDGKTITEKKKWKYFQLSEYKFLTYTETKEAVSELARGLIELGVTSDDVFNVYAATSVNWQLMSHACVSISVPVATAYDTLGESGLAHSLNEPHCIGLFTNAELLTTVLHVLSDVPSIKYIIFDGKPSQDVISKIKAVRDTISVYSLDELRALGRDKPTEPLASRVPKADTLACIMYTSGSTGAPKGVCITNANLVASVAAVKTLLGHHFQETDTFLAYLPLAHILEYIVELCFLFIGMKMGYGRVKTLTDASVRNCLGDLREFKPSIMVGVPAVWETIRKGILSKVHAGGTLKKSVFNGALAVKKAGVPGLSQLADAAVMNKIKEATGGRLRIALSGGAAISQATQEFLNLALTTLVQGYGMTETCGMCAILPPEMVRFGAVGLPVPAVEIKLRDVEEAGYLSTNDPPQGEVCLRGTAVIKEYYKRPDLNEDESIFTKDGWFRTGDVGQWNKDGTLSIIDRIKNLVKLSGGEYIALERLESVYRSCNLVGNICVYASQDAKQPIAIIIPHESHLRAALVSSSNSSASSKSKSKDESSLEELCKDKDVQNLILKECNAVAKKNAFKPMEMLQAVILTHEEWTPENGLVTAAQKIQRSKIAKRFEKEITEIYKQQ